MLRKLVVIAVVVAIAGALPMAAPSAKTGQARTAATRTVEVHDDFFRSKRITVRKGTVVVFAWEGINRHNARGFEGQRFTTGKNGRVNGEKGVRITAARGTRIRYLCEFHPDTMRGSITVSRRR